MRDRTTADLWKLIFLFKIHVYFAPTNIFQPVSILFKYAVIVLHICFHGMILHNKEDTQTTCKWLTTPVKKDYKPQEPHGVPKMLELTFPCPCEGGSSIHSRTSFSGELGRGGVWFMCWQPSLLKEKGSPPWKWPQHPKSLLLWLQGWAVFTCLSPGYLI